LRLPVELRLHIYSFALLEREIWTIGAAQIVGKQHEILHRLYGDDRRPYPGIPQYHEPVVGRYYAASLLSSTSPGVLLASAQAREDLVDETHKTAHTAHQALLLVNKQVHEELTSYFDAPKNRPASLFLQFPTGLHVFHTLTPHLLRQAKSIHIAGSYISRTFNSTRAACLGPQHPVAGKGEYSGGLIPDSRTQLGELVASCFGPEPRHNLTQLDIRIYYPGEDSYSTVWGDDSSPIVVALRNICYGDIRIEVWRGRVGTGVYFSARPCEDGEKRRLVSTVWRRLEEGRKGEPRCGEWIVDPKWPVW
ncbi:hypothetical protein BAUCODRAFT_44464, partial [Baudoinia panamericana UAMH 10762]